MVLPEVTYLNTLLEENGSEALIKWYADFVVENKKDKEIAIFASALGNIVSSLIAANHHKKICHQLIELQTRLSGAP